MRYGFNYALSLKKGMKWTVYGIKGAKHGHMNINTVGEEKLCVHYMQGKIVSVL